MPDNNMIKHTPGPWLINPIRDFDKSIFIDAPGVKIDYDDIDQDEQQANARLIAAAPDLLAALRCALEPISVIARIGKIPQGGEQSGNMQHIIEARNRIVAAIQLSQEGR